MMQMLYYLKPAERKDLFKKLHEQWLDTGRYAFVMSASHMDSPDDVNEIYVRMGVPLVKFETIEAEVLEAGFIKHYTHEIQCMQDFSNLDESFLRFFEGHADRQGQHVSLDVIRNIIKELFAGGKSDHDFYTFAMFQKA